MSATRKTFVSEGFARVRAALRQRFVDEEPDGLSELEEYICEGNY